MVERLRAAGITDPRVLAAMAEVPRERFVPAAFRLEAYADHPLDIGLGQTISAPWIVAFSAAALDVARGVACWRSAPAPATAPRCSPAVAGTS